MSAAILGLLAVVLVTWALFVTAGVLMRAWGLSAVEAYALMILGLALVAAVGGRERS